MQNPHTETTLKTNKMNSDQIQSQPRDPIFQGILYSNLFALAAFAIAYTVTNWNEDVGGVLSFSEFVLVPIAMGMIAMKFWMVTKKRLLALFPYALLNTVIGISLSAVFMGEGYICIIIVSPLVLAFMWIGVIIAKYVLPNRNKTIRASTFSLLILLFVYDTLSEHNYVNEVTDEITIHASRSKVWNYVAEHPVNTQEPEYWLFRIGLPSPIQSTVSGNTVGSERKCIFSNGATFDEIVVHNTTDSLFTFDIIQQPADPEIIGHIEIRRGQFILQSNPDGSTTLIGTSWYKLKVYPVWYYDIWAEKITREVHLRVMKHIKTLAENDV
jgi:hypothetical protein